jgi:hypothetical protein
LEVIITNSLKQIPGNFTVTKLRDFEPAQTAGYQIYFDGNGKLVPLFKIDININQVVTSGRIYNYGDVAIRGVYPNQVLSDKISVLSGDHIFRRAKDVIDTYALAHCLEVHTDDIFRTIHQRDLTLGSFEPFMTREPFLRHAYDKLRKIVGKPPFDHVYLYLKKFLNPFITNNRISQVWHHGEPSWSEEKENTRPRM